LVDALRQLSFRLRRFCEGSQATSSLATFNGISFPGSQAGNISYFLLNPSQITTSVSCSVNAVCENGGCRCKPGFVGDGFNCTGTFWGSKKPPAARAAVPDIELSRTA